MRPTNARSHGVLPEYSGVSRTTVASTAAYEPQGNTVLGIWGGAAGEPVNGGLRLQER